MIKKATISAIFMLIAAVCLQAQFVKSIAVKPGIVWSAQKMDYKNMSVNDARDALMGLHLGVNAEFFDHAIFSLLAEAGYTAKGNSEEVEITNAAFPEGTGQFETFKSRFNYVYFAPMLKARLEFGRFIPYIFAGPRADMYVSYSSDLDWGEVEEDFNSLVWGINYGLGLEFRFGRLGAGVVFSQQYDFSEAYGKDPGQMGLESIRNNAFVLDLGLKLYFGGE